MPRLHAPSNAETCRSGRTGRSRKPLSLHGFPGFESLRLRQKIPSLLFGRRCAKTPFKPLKINKSIWLFVDWAGVFIDYFYEFMMTDYVENEDIGDENTPIIEVGDQFSGTLSAIFGDAD